MTLPLDFSWIRPCRPTLVNECIAFGSIAQLTSQCHSWRHENSQDTQDSNTRKAFLMPTIWLGCTADVLGPTVYMYSRPIWLLFPGGSPTFVWPWEESNYPSRSCNGPNGPKGPKLNPSKNKRRGRLILV